MRRSGVVGLAIAGLVATVGVVGSVSAADGPAGAGLAPDKTLGPTTAAPAEPGAAPPSSVPPLGTYPAQPTSAPPTSTWILTTAPTTVPLAPAPPVTAVPTVSPTVATTVTTEPPAVKPTGPITSFDGRKWLTEVYAAVRDDPFALLDIAEQSTVINSPADLFLAHLLGIAINEQFDAGMPPAVYTVALDGKAVSVCSDTTCDVFSDFYAPTGLVETFNINGVPLAMSGGRRGVNVESLGVDSTLCLARSDGSLSCVLLLSSEGAATALHWEQVVFTAVDGRQFAPDLSQSVFSRSIADGGVGSGHVVFPGAPLEGDITLPIVSGMSGTPNVVTVEVREI